MPVPCDKNRRSNYLVEFQSIPLIKRTYELAPACPLKKRTVRRQSATPLCARPRVGVNGSPAPRFLGFLRNPAESQRRAAITPTLARQ